MPFASLVKDIHFLSYHVGIDHVEINAVVLFEEYLPLGTPVVVSGNRDDFLYRNIHFEDSSHAEDMHLKVFGLREQFHFENKVLSDHLALNKERN